MFEPCFRLMIAFELENITKEIELLVACMIANETLITLSVNGALTSLFGSMTPCTEVQISCNISFKCSQKMVS